MNIMLRARLKTANVAPIPAYAIKQCLLIILAAALVLITPSFAASQSDEEKAKRAEFERMRAEVEARNQKIIALNSTINRTFKAGNDALKAGNYDEAIAQYNEGLAADPEQVALWTNKSIALRIRGVNRFNLASRSGNAATKKSEREAAAKDTRESFEAGSKAVELLKKQPANEQSKYSSISARAEAARILGKLDSSLIGEAGFTAIEEYVAIEPDEGKRMQAQLDAAQLLFEMGQLDRAAVEFRKLVSENSYNFDAVLGLGLSLFGTGNQSNMAEAEKNLQRFMEIAPDTHPKKSQVREALQYLKQQH